MKVRMLIGELSYGRITLKVHYAKRCFTVPKKQGASSAMLEALLIYRGTQMKHACDYWLPLITVVILLL